MGEEWIVRVEGKEYGPVETDELREWQREGRLIPENPVRRDGDPTWLKASDIPGVFPPAEIQQPEPASRTLGQIIVESFRLYRLGFRHFLVLALITALPSICAQLSAPAANIPADAVPDVQMAAAAGFSCFTILLNLAMWPVFLAAIQIATADLVAGRPLRTFELLRQAVTFWPRVALLCLFVYGSYFFWTALPFAVIVAIAASGPPPAPTLQALLMLALQASLALLVLAFQVWITARLFTNFLFWQQSAVIARLNINDTLRQSKDLGRSGNDRPWYQRPLWRGAVLASLWCTIVILLNIEPLWQLVRTYFHQLTISQDPQALMQALSSVKSQSPMFLTVLLGLLQIVLRPLLGISFVILYFDSKTQSGG
jgi:hypothetical protein